MYGGLGSGRLVIAGGPGAGKSGAAVLLILAALRHRRGVREEARPEVPVPVMFTLHGWDPGAQRARDWLAERLWQTYPLFAGRHGAEAARGMLDEGRIAVILDGLDEIPEDLRPTALRALSQLATFRLVLLTRSAEMAGAAARAALQGAAAIELQDIAPGVAAGYLTRTQLDPPPRGWQELTRRLRQHPGSPLAQALNNPLMLTLVRDTYRADDDIGELLSLRDAAGHPASSQDIADYLLDRVLPAAYTPQPGEPPPRYDLPAGTRAAVHRRADEQRRHPRPAMVACSRLGPCRPSLHRDLVRRRARVRAPVGAGGRAPVRALGRDHVRALVWAGGRDRGWDRVRPGKQDG